MKNLNILIVEGNTQEENLKLQKLSNQPQSFNFRNNILKYYPDAVIDIVTPSTKNEASKFIPELNKYDGIIWGGSTLNIYEDKPEIRRQLEFAKKVGIAKPRVAVLSGTEDPIESMPSSMEAKEIMDKSKKENIDAYVHGPLAFDNAISPKAAQIKKIQKIFQHQDIFFL